MNIKNCLKECSQSRNRKRVAIIGLYYHPKMPSRVKMVWSYYRERFETRIITSDFVHPTKQYDKTDWKDCIKLHVPAYKTNISIQRILSHLSYALQINKQLKIFNPDLIYICVPPNYSALRAVRWARKHKIPSIIDIVDIWPNANIDRHSALYWFYSLWAGMRIDATRNADKVILECENYAQFVSVKNFKVIPLCKEAPHQIHIDQRSNQLSVGYLGAFSTSYDFNSLIQIVASISDRLSNVILIGDGSEKEKVVKELEKIGVNYSDYGSVYNESMVAEILSNCDFGYNGFKEDMIVGQSFKSLDYMSIGLPVINSMKGDLWDNIESHNAGINFSSRNIKGVIDRLLTITRDEVEQMRSNTKKVFSEKYSWDVYRTLMDEIVNEVIDEEEV